MTTEILLVILASSALAAVINKAGEYVLYRRKHKDDKDDKDDNNLKAINRALRHLLRREIIDMAQDAVTQGEVTLVARKEINDMHTTYHELGGNGDLDTLMAQINDLPLDIS